MANYKQNITLHAGWDGKEVEAGLKETTNLLEKADSWAKKFTANLAANLASSAIQNAISGLSSAFDKLKTSIIQGIDIAANWEQQQLRVSNTLKNLGTSYDQQEEKIKSLRGEMEVFAGANIREFNTAFETVLTLSQDVNGTYNRMGLVFEVAAAKQLDVAQAAELVGRAMAGHKEQLATLFPTLRKFTEEQWKSGEAFQALSKQIGGSATAAINTYRGAWGNLVNAIEDAKGRMLKETLPAFTEMFNELNAKITKFSTSEAGERIATSLGNIAENVKDAVIGIMGGDGNTGLVDAVQSLLDEFEAYTGSDKFKTDLQSVSATVMGLAESVADLTTKLNELLPLLTALGYGGKIVKAYGSMLPGIGTSFSGGTVKPGEGFEAHELPSASGFYDGGLIPGVYRGFDDRVGTVTGGGTVRLAGGEYIVTPNMFPYFGGLEYMESLRQALNGAQSPGGFSQGGSIYERLASQYSDKSFIGNLLGIVKMGLSDPGAAVARLEQHLARRAQYPRAYPGWLDEWDAYSKALSTFRSIASNSEIAIGKSEHTSALWGATQTKMVELAQAAKDIPTYYEAMEEREKEERKKRQSIPLPTKPFSSPDSTPLLGNLRDIDYAAMAAKKDYSTWKPQPAVQFGPQFQDGWVRPITPFQQQERKFAEQFDFQVQYNSGWERYPIERYANPYAGKGIFASDIQEIRDIGFWNWAYQAYIKRPYQYVSGYSSGRGYADGGYVPPFYTRAGAGGGGRNQVYFPQSGAIPMPKQQPEGWYLLSVGRPAASSGRRIIEALQQEGVDVFETQEQASEAWRTR